MKKNQRTSKRALKTKKPKSVKPNNDFLTSGAQNFYVTENSIAAQRVMSIDKNGKPIDVRTVYYAKTPEREEAMKRAGIKSGKAIKGNYSGQTTFRR